uniref:Epsin-2-like n=1 Tax=Petromyzon marinus TaxID=7757 RepID=A0AAJ7TFB4_PETMA|nr:epsin-2-like [Petromyzon marinus]
MAFSLRRQVKNIVNNYSEAEIKVREATSNDPWGPSSSLMAEIAELTYNSVAYEEVMTMLWKRMSDGGRNWRHVYKALVLLECLTQIGNEKVTEQCREHLSGLKMLQEFRFVDRDGKDYGVNVREKSKQLVALLQDEALLQSKRELALKTKERMAQSKAKPGGAAQFLGGLSRSPGPREALGSASSDGGDGGGSGGSPAAQRPPSSPQVAADTEQGEQPHRAEEKAADPSVPAEQEPRAESRAEQPTTTTKEAATVELPLLDIGDCFSSPLTAGSTAPQQQQQTQPLDVWDTVAPSVAQNDPWSIPPARPAATATDSKPSARPSGVATPAPDPWASLLSGPQRSTPVPACASVDLLGDDAPAAFAAAPAAQTTAVDLLQWPGVAATQPQAKVAAALALGESPLPLLDLGPVAPSPAAAAQPGASAALLLPSGQSLATSVSPAPVARPAAAGPGATLAPAAHSAPPPVAAPRSPRVSTKPQQKSTPAAAPSAAATTTTTTSLAPGQSPQPQAVSPGSGKPPARPPSPRLGGRIPAAPTEQQQQQQQQQQQREQQQREQQQQQQQQQEQQQREQQQQQQREQQQQEQQQREQQQREQQQREQQQQQHSNLDDLLSFEGPNVPLAAPIKIPDGTPSVILPVMQALAPSSGLDDLLGFSSEILQPSEPQEQQQQQKEPGTASGYADMLSLTSPRDDASASSNGEPESAEAEPIVDAAPPPPCDDPPPARTAETVASTATSSEALESAASRAPTGVAAAAAAVAAVTEGSPSEQPEENSHGADPRVKDLQEADGLALAPEKGQQHVLEKASVETGGVAESAVIEEVAHRPTSNGSD